MVMTAIAPPPAHDQLEPLLLELTRLCEHVLYRSAIRLDQQARFLDQAALNKSCVNLAHYLALRELDLRPLQEKLAETGLSSLGRAESHVFATLQAVISMLSQALGKQSDIECRLPYPAFREGFTILNRNTEHLLGPAGNQYETRIMVTLPGEAASNPQLVHDLIREGMDCARINCAHDNAEIWEDMVRQIREAARLQQRECKILMDLAGHKVRTGPLAQEPGSIHIKVRKNRYGLRTQPVQLVLIPASGGNIPQPARERTIGITVPDKILNQLRSGDRLVFDDARGKKRHFLIYKDTDSQQWLASCHKTAVLRVDTKIFLSRRRGFGYTTIDSFIFNDVLRQSVRINLQTNDELVLHATQEPGEPARYDSQGNLLTPAHISCTVPQVFRALSPGDSVWIDDGKISCQVEQVDNNAASLRVLRTGPKGAALRADKGLNFPDTDLQLPALSDKDMHDLDFVCQHADLVGFSFVESGDDIRLLIRELGLRNRSHLPIVAKIETSRAVHNLPEILFSSLSQHPLAIMIARGDLAVELGSVRMAEIQEEILWLCEAAHVPVIWATQVLESIAKHGVRSRPEFTDAAMGIRAECVMLNKGPYILDAVRSLNAVLKRMQAHQRKKISRLRALHW